MERSDQVVLVLAALLLRVRGDEDRVAADFLVEALRGREQQAHSLLEGDVLGEQGHRHALDVLVENDVDPEGFCQELESLLEVGLPEVERDRRLRRQRQTLGLLLVVLLLQLGERRRRVLVVRKDIEGPLELAPGVVELARLLQVQPLDIEIRRLLARERIVHRLLQLAMIRQRRESLLVLHDSLVQGALLQQALSALVVEVGRLELGLPEPGTVLDVGRGARQCLAVFEDRLEPFVLRRILVGLLDRGRGARSEQGKRREDGEATKPQSHRHETSPDMPSISPRLESAR